MSHLSHWHWMLAGVVGVAGGLILAVVVDEFVAAIRLWFHRPPTVAAHFSPRGGCVAAIVTELAVARREILVQAYSFSCPDIVKGLVAASARGVRVVVLLDRSNELESYSALGDLKKGRIDVRIDAQHAIAHNKVIVIDGRTIITGSFNFTRQAENENAENLLILRDHRDLASRYRLNFQTHRDHSHPPGMAGPPSAPQAGRRANYSAGLHGHSS